MNVLITNDDGIHAEGLMVLKKALADIARVHVLAPDRPRSACGHSITLHKPLRVDSVRLPDGSTGFACSGTPSDCVNLALMGVIEAKIDLVISGINKGPNLGWDLTYSGTVSAAMEGVVSGVQSMAVSVAGYEKHANYATAARVAVSLAQFLASSPLPEATLLNVNVPNVPPDRVQGTAVTRQGKRTYEGELVKRSDPFGREYYWIGGELPVDHFEEGTDVTAIKEGKVSVTPIHLDLTDHASVSRLKELGIEALVF